jgi:hypothetical protein
MADVPPAAVHRPRLCSGTGRGCGLSIDDVVELAPAGEIPAVKLRRQYAWVPADDAKLWAETMPAATPIAQRERDHLRSMVAACRRPHTAPAAPPQLAPSRTDLELDPTSSRGSPTESAT